MMTDSDREAILVLCLRHLGALGQEQIARRDSALSHDPENKEMLGAVADDRKAWSRIYLNAAILRATQKQVRNH